MKSDRERAVDTRSIPETSFRTATARDIGALRQFEQGIVSAERAFDPTLKTGRVQYYDIEKMMLERRRAICGRRTRQ